MSEPGIPPNYPTLAFVVITGSHAEETLNSFNLVLDGCSLVIIESVDQYIGWMDVVFKYCQEARLNAKCTIIRCGIGKTNQMGFRTLGLFN